MRQMLIIADDLSGAADSATACVMAGLSAAVALDENGRHLQSDVVAVDCDTRSLPAPQAAERVRSIMRAFDATASDLLLVKKIDSSLRGHVGAEIAATLTEQRIAARDQRVVAVAAPAFPSNGRTTVNGYQLVHGRPLRETEMWIHERIEGDGHIPSLLALAGLLTVTLNLQQVRSGIDPLSHAMREASRTADVLVCDAETEEDLSMIASASLALGRKTVWVGSAGLAYHLPNVAGLVSRASNSRVLKLRAGPVLFVIGSMSRVSSDQASPLAKETSVDAIRVSPRTLLDGPSTLDWDQIAARIESSLHAGRTTLVELDSGEWMAKQSRRALTGALGAMLKPFQYAVGALVASGGETARAVLSGWGVDTLRLVSEVEPGLPFSVVEWEGGALPVLTKAGSFGTHETLLRCLDFLNQLERST